MKSTGIVRKLDQLGRINIPIALRRTLDIKAQDPVGLFIDNDKIIFKKHTANNACLITGDVSANNMELENGIVLSPEGAEILLEKLKKEQE